MKRYIAFLGGINVGGHRVTMERLRSLCEQLGLVHVSTFIASGNVLFSTKTSDAAKVEAKLERHLEESLGYRVPVLLREGEDLASIVAYEPFNREILEAAGHTLHVCFLKGTLTEADAEAVRGFGTSMDELHPHGREMYWLCRGKITGSQLKWPAIAKKTGVSTARNITMLRRLLQTMASTGPEPT